MAAMPAALKARGISQATWKALRPEAQRELVKQSNKVATIAKREGQGPERKERLARARGRRYASKPRAQRTGAGWPDDEIAEFWKEYRRAIGLS